MDKSINSSKGLSIYLIATTIVAALGGLLFGFDMAVISGVLPFIKEQFSLSAAQEGWFVSSALIGCIIGVSFSGGLSDSIGRKRMLMLAGLLFFISAVGTALAPEFELLICARMLGGMGVGVASIVAPLYISEISPASVRGRLVTFYQLAITLGILVAYLTNSTLLQYAMSHKSAQIGSMLNTLFIHDVWRGMLGLGIIPSSVFLIGLWFVPESPKWLIENGKTDEGFKKVTRLEGIDAALILSKSSTKSVKSKGTYKDLLSPKLRKPFLIGILLPLFSQFSGINAVIYYGPRILNSAGIEIRNAFFTQIIFGLANFLFTIIAIWKVDKMGRRPLYLIGSAGAAISLFLTGCCFYLNITGGYLMIISIILFLACFAFSIGPLKFVIAAEIFPTEIRGRAMGVSIMVMWIADTIVGQLTPVMLNSAGPGWTFWFFSICCALSFWVVIKKVPETKGKTLDQVQELWGGH
jgi:SP family arabinose:H+ symporter-like MFS transporter